MMSYFKVMQSIAVKAQTFPCVKLDFPGEQERFWADALPDAIK